MLIFPVAERVEEKEPRDNEGKTPLHEAITNGHYGICKILLDIWGMKNPTLTKSPKMHHRNVQFNRK